MEENESKVTSEKEEKTKPKKSTKSATSKSKTTAKTSSASSKTKSSTKKASATKTTKKSTAKSSSDKAKASEKKASTKKTATKKSDAKKTTKTTKNSKTKASSKPKTAKKATKKTSANTKKSEPKKENIFVKFMNKDKDRIKTLFIIESLFIFIVEMLSKIFLKTFVFDFTILRIALSSIILAYLITIITNNMNKYVRRVILIAFNFFVVFYAWLQIGFMKFLGAFMSMGNASQGTKVTDYIFDFLGSYKWYIHLLYVPLVLFIVYIIFYEEKFTHKGYEARIKPTLKKTIISILVFALVCGCYYSTITLKFMQSKFQSISNKMLFKYPSNPSIAIKNYGTTVYFLLDIKGTALGQDDEVYAAQAHKAKLAKTRKIDDTAFKKLVDNETDESLNALNKYFINKDIPEKNKYTGKFKNKNLVMIMMESVSQAVFSDKYKEYFPTLNKLYNEGITGVNNYSPKNNCATGESEMTSQISVYSIETTCTVNTYRNNKYPEALLSMLSKNGYYTSTYHDYSDHYYYRNTFEYNFGTQKYYSVTDLGIPYSTEYKEWPSDKTMMEKAVPKFIDEDQFASYMITVTSHTPYIYSSTYGDMYLDLFKDLDVDTATKRYLSKVKVVDTAVEYLMDELKKEGKLDDTVIVLFGDHFPYALSHDEFQSIADYDISLNQETDRTPFIIYNSKTKPEKITKITSPMDYTPTLLNLFGIDYDPRLYFGHDIFSNYTDFAVFPDNSWQAEKGFYNASKGEFVPKDANDTLSDDEIIKINNEVNDMRNMSSQAIRTDYYNYLFENLEKYKNEESSQEQSKKNKESE